VDWLSLSLLSAFSLASADAATKAWLGGYNAREITLVRFSLTGLLISPLLLQQPLPELPPAFWVWLAALVPLEILAMLLYMRAIRDHPLVLTLPYLAFTPVFVVITGYLLLGESVSLRGFTGILLVVAGAWLMNREQVRRPGWYSWWAPLRSIFTNPGSGMMLGVAGLYSLTSVMGKGAVQYMPPAQFGPFYWLVLGLITPLLFAATSPGCISALWRRPLANLAVAACTGVMAVAHFLAIQEVEVAYMIAVKRTSLLFGILYGALLFGESGLGLHLFAGAMMLAGVVLISL
jgi:drug/metabolite transporter (DMT)-like permease